MGVFEVFGIDTVVSVEVALHVYEEYCDVNEVFPFGAAGFEDGANVLEYAVALGFEVERLELTVFVQLEAWDAVVGGVAGAYA